MKIYVDADGCPVVRICTDTAAKYGKECIIVSDTAHIFNIEGAKCVTVSKGSDSADFYIANSIENGDIAVTQDYGLAAMCLARGAKVLTQNGFKIDEGNIDSLLMSRFAAQRVRRAGGRLKGPAPRKRVQDDDFCRALTVLLNNAE